MPTASIVRKQESRPRPRPRFDLFVPRKPAQVHADLKAAIKDKPGILGIAIDHERFEIMRDDRSWRIWAPQLDVKVLPADDGTRVMGRFSPHPNVWMAYLSLYFTAAVFAIACATYGIVQLILDYEPWALYLAPIAIIVAGLVYGASYVGQGLATAEMYELREFLEDSIETDTDE